MISDKRLRALCSKVLRRVGVPSRDAFVVADNLVDANLRGIDSHGVVRLPKYVKGLLAGTINARPHIKITRPGKTVIQVYGDNGLGAVVARRAVKSLITVCKLAGAAACGIRGSNHFGTITYYLIQVTKARLIGVGITHGESLQVPFGGNAPFFGTNPIAFAFPTRKSPPLIADFATSATTFGKILQARADGSLLPSGTVQDAQGEPTTDPARAARILPAAGHKGYGLALAVEILSGILNGCPYGPHIPPVFRDDIEKPGNLGHFFFALDPHRFCGRKRFLDQLETMIEELHQVPPAPGFAAVLVPGEPESRIYAKRIREGIPLEKGLLDRIEGLDRAEHLRLRGRRYSL